MSGWSGIEVGVMMLRGAPYMWEDVAKVRERCGDLGEVGYRCGGDAVGEVVIYVGSVGDGGIGVGDVGEMEYSYERVSGR